MFIAAQVKIISKINGFLPVAIVTRWVVELCSPEQLKGKVYIYMVVFFQQRKCSCSMSVLPFMSGGSVGVEGNICEKGLQICNVLFCSYCHFPQISS